MIEKADKSTIFDERETASDNEYMMIGNVIETAPGEFLVIDVRNAFEKGQSIEVLPFKGESVEVSCDFIEGLDGEAVERTKPSTLVKIPWVQAASKNNILRARRCKLTTYLKILMSLAPPKKRDLKKSLFAQKPLSLWRGRNRAGPRTR